ncbi:hypothetical protein BLNAU_3608 [Blattamonas nauphoetae]|uniref:Uncharacterized protein n=1 Tax=Blattamonas nauphoetae TaxID=2049346 RepID=A0ABQ9YCI8_9EUKA|nr:hypothetical protein BLNAU_3608 [Blattamonas nauphoetae]
MTHKMTGVFQPQLRHSEFGLNLMVEMGLVGNFELLKGFDQNGQQELSQVEAEQGLSEERNLILYGSLCTLDGRIGPNFLSSLEQTSPFFKECNDEIENLRQQLKVSIPPEKYELLEQEAKELKTKNIFLEKQLMSRSTREQSVHENLQSAIGSSQSKLAESEQKNSHLQSQITHLEHLIEDRERALDNLHSTVTAQDHQIRLLQNENILFQKRLDSIEKQHERELQDQALHYEQEMYILQHTLHKSLKTP